MADDNVAHSGRTAADFLHALVKGGLGTVPVAGSLLSEFFGYLIAPEAERRRDRFLNDLAASIAQLEAAGKLTVESLQNNEQFITTLVQATQAAMRDHVEEKRAALRNAILNSVTPTSMDGARNQMFVRMIDEFTAWHLRILALVRHPAEWFAAHGKDISSLHLQSRGQVYEAAFPALKGESDIYDQVYQDLGQSGLIDTVRPGQATHSAMWKQPAITELGRKFLVFITAPPALKSAQPPMATPAP